MKKTLPDYFIAIIPPSPIFEKALELKNYFKEKYNSKASLNSPPHVTLHMPFQWKEEEENILIEQLAGFAKPFQPFELKLLNFNCFEPRVIFIDVEKNEKLNDLQAQLHRFCEQELNLFNANYKERPYHPHLTLAFRDLRKQKFVGAWQEFRAKNFSAEFRVEQISLLKHDGVKWNVAANISFGSL